MAFISLEHTEEYIRGLVERSRKAQKEFETKFKEQRVIDEVLHAMAVSMIDNAEALGQAAVSESGMGNLESKKRKLIGCAVCAWRDCRGHQSVGYQDCPDEPGVRFMFKPMGVVGAVMPSTNPLATIISNGMHALKCRNSIIIAPHPATAKVSDQALALIQDAIEAVGAPRDLVLGISAEEASVEATNILLQYCDVNIGTGGPGMVKAVYSSGKPAFGVGQGNCQDVIDLDIAAEEYDKIAWHIIQNRIMDNGVPCVGDQTIHVPEQYEQQLVDAMRANGAYVLETKEQVDALRDVIFPDGGTRINRDIVGRLPYMIGEMCGIDIPKEAKIIFLKNQAWADQDTLCREILAPVVRYTTYTKFEDAVDRAIATLNVEGAGHSSAIWTHTQEHIDYAADLFPVGRFRVNMPTGSGSGVPTGLLTSSTIGCGTWGGNSISEYLTWKHLYNKTKVVTRVDNLRPFDMEKEIDNYDIWIPTME